MTFEEFQSQYSNETPNIEGLNQQLLSRAVDVGETEGVYRVGPGDEITMDVFGVDELTGNYRIDGMGRVSLPLIGNCRGFRILAVRNRGCTRTTIRRSISPRPANQRFGIVEFRSQQFTAMGALSQPRVYNTQRKITLIEAIAMAGGLSSNAGQYVYLTDRVRNPETGELGTRSLAVAIEDLTRGNRKSISCWATMH